MYEDVLGKDLGKKIEKVEAIKNTVLDDDDTVLIRVDIENMPRRVASKYMKNIRDAFKIAFPKNQILVIPSQLEVEIIKMLGEEHK